MTLKKLSEKREALQVEMETILTLADTEERAMTEDEINRFDEIEKEIRAIDTTMEKVEKSRNIDKKTTTGEKGVEERAAAEERAFVEYVLSTVENRAALTQGNNGAIVPKTIADRIISEVKTQIPFFEKTEYVETTGTMSYPVYTEDATDKIVADYADENSDVTANSGAFTTIDLNGYLIRALTLLSNKLRNNTEVNVTDYIVKKVAEAIVSKLMTEFTTGTTRIKGVLTSQNVVTAAASTAITYDEILKLKFKLPQRYRENAYLIMHPSTHEYLLSLKDGNDRPYFEEGKPIKGMQVLESVDMPEIAAGAKALAVADFSGYGIKAAKSVEVQILREAFAVKGMIGILGFAEYDANILDKQKFAVLQMKA